MAKIRPYYELRVQHYLSLMDQKQQAEFDAEYEALKPKEQLKQLRLQMKLLDPYVKLLKKRQYLRNELSITIDLDNVEFGFPKIVVKPQLPCSFGRSFKTSLFFSKNGSVKQVQEIVVGPNAAGGQI